MKALRIKVKQKIAHFRKEGSSLNKMTYPLPHPSTVVGAIHEACGWKEYRELKVSIAGNYESRGEKVYTHHAILNNVFDDRGILIYNEVPAAINSATAIKVASCIRQGSKFSSKIDIDVYNENLLDKYIEAKSIEDNKKRAEAMKHFKTLTTSIKKYELLYNLDLTLHISAAEDILQEIEDNIFNITAIGRAEDFVELNEELTGIVELKEIDKEIISKIGQYINFDKVRGDLVDLDESKGGQKNGTRYKLTKKYEINKKGQRIFERHDAIYTSKYIVNKSSVGIYSDDLDNIVDLI